MFRSFLYFILLAAMLAFLLPVAAAEPTVVPKASTFTDGWTMTFNDEFAGPTLDRSKWATSWGTRLNNGPEQLQAFVDDAFRFQNGTLQIVAERRQYAQYQYTSGQLLSLNSFSQRYGYYELRGKPAAGQGMWSSFWLLGEQWPPEMDILEVLGRLPNTHHTNYHWSHSTTGEHQKYTQTYVGSDLTKGFHVYGLEWLPDRMNWYLDGKRIATHTVGVGQANKPMMLLIDLAIGGWARTPNSQTPFPNTFDIDYVRVWQRDTYPVPAPTPTPATGCVDGAIEAEQGARSGTFVLRNDQTASGGVAVETNPTISHAYNTIAASSGRLDVCLKVPEDGTYEVWARVRSGGRNQHAFYVQVDNAPEDGYTWNFSPPDFLWHEYAVTDQMQKGAVIQVPLRAGAHWVQVWMLEAGAQIDRIELRRVGATPNQPSPTPTSQPTATTAPVETVSPITTPVAPTSVAPLPSPTVPVVVPTAAAGSQYQVFLPFVRQR